MNPQKVIIIGSGLGGLVCAHILASEGYRVLVLEREAQAGGCMQSYRRRGVELDTGFHYVGGLDPGQSLHEPFRMLGLLKLPWVRMDTDCFDRIHINGESYDFAQGYDRFVETLASRFPSQRQALQEYVEMLKRSSREQYDWIKPDNAGDSSNAIAEQTYLPAFQTPAWKWLHDHFSDERLINVLSGNATRIELRRDTLPLFTLSHINSSYIASAWRLAGSGKLIVDSLAKDIRDNGGEILCNKEVTKLTTRDGRIATAQTADGETYEADIFISDAHPAVTASLVDNNGLVLKRLKRRFAMLENTFGMLTVSLVLKPGSLPYVGHNDYIYNTSDIWGCTDSGAPHPVNAVMVSYRSPEGKPEDKAQVVDLMTPISWDECRPWEATTSGRRGKDYDDWKQSKADECVRLAQTVIPGLTDMVETRYVSTPLTYRDYTLTPQGSAYGVRKDCANPLMTIVSSRTPASNLMLTGQSLLLHGVEGVTVTALVTCSKIIGKQRLWEKLGMTSNNKTTKP